MSKRNMKTQNKKQIESALNRIVELAWKRAKNEEERKIIAEEEIVLMGFIAEVFEFDFFQLKEDIDFIKTELVDLRK